MAMVIIGLRVPCPLSSSSISKLCSRMMATAAFDDKDALGRLMLEYQTIQLHSVTLLYNGMQEKQQMHGNICIFQVTIIVFNDFSTIPRVIFKGFQETTEISTWTFQDFPDFIRIYTNPDNTILCTRIETFLSSGRCTVSILTSISYGFSHLE